MVRTFSLHWGRIVVLLALSLAVQTKTLAQQHDQAFWQSIADNHYSVPPNTSAAELSRELSGLLGSPDPRLRDELAYSILTNWIYQSRVLSPDVIRTLMSQWMANLNEQPGSIGTNAVLRRSFSALMLSVAAARDNAQPFLSEAEYRSLLGSALTYLAAEHDLRGYDERLGWIHATAHTADLLKFLARSRYLTPADQAAILTAISNKLQGAGTVFQFGEDERMARALLSLCMRKDFDQEAFRTWTTRIAPLPPATARPDVARLLANQNLKNTLAKLALLTLEAPEQSPKLIAASEALRSTLKDTF